MPGYRPTYQLQRSSLHAPQHRPGRYEIIEVTPLTGALGARVEGVDLGDLSDAALAEIQRALVDHLVLSFPDQALDPAAQVRFARRFGSPMDYPFAKVMPAHPEITEIISEPNDVYNFGSCWHTDSSNFERPPKITILQCEVCPTTGGDTSFANQYLAWDTLSAGMRRMLGELRAVHSTALSYGSASTTSSTTLKAYVCEVFTARFVDMSQDESLPLLRYLWAHSRRPEFTCRVRWRPGTLTMWDNRCAIHYAHNDYTGQRRLMRRIIIQGDRPA